MGDFHENGKLSKVLIDKVNSTKEVSREEEKVMDISQPSLVVKTKANNTNLHFFGLLEFSLGLASPAVEETQHPVNPN